MCASEKKGIVFSSDAVVAAVVLSLFAVSFAFLSAKSSQESHAQLLLKKQAGDMLMALDKTGGLSAGNLSELNSSLAQALPAGTGWNISLEYYNYSGGFMLDRQESAASGQASARSAVSAQREFLSLSNGSVRHYGVARLMVWKG